MPNVTVVIPVAGYHSEIAARAIASVEAQTVPCEIVVVPDTSAKGAGWARNRGLESVNTDYVVFLDADDEIAPDFVETCLNAITPSHYVYTDWVVDGQHIAAPDPCVLWTKKTFHVVTTLMRTEDIRRIGGYDELLPGAEDTDLGLRLRLSGVCGIRIPAPLFNWGDGGLRSKDLRASGKEAVVLAYFNERYGGYQLMGCCGDYNLPTSPGNDPQPGWVLVQALWAGNRQEWGRVTGILYPRSGNLKTLYIDPRDAEAMPDKYRVVQSGQAANGVVLQPQYQPRNDWQHVANAVFGGAQPNAPQQPASSPIEYKPLANQNSKQDILSKVKNGG